ncbi:MAG: hypothetical protein ACI8PP_002033 [Candidatus Pseudothioglobus sp.]|jgi:hypothetical protein
MNATPRSKKHQQLRVSKARATTDSLAFFNLLTSGEVPDELEQTCQNTARACSHPLKRYRCS